jgi:putative FmdB family regulatory protein
MPVYEYYCEPCNGVFELLRPAREASKAQPCPECDDDAKRIISREWSAFIYREGAPRRLPDTGGYWHLGKRVSKPLTGTIEGSGLRHPELDDRPPPRPLTPEELEAAEYRRDVKRRAFMRREPMLVNQEEELREQKLRTHMAQTRGSSKTERIKRRFSAREHEEARRDVYKMEQGKDPTD